MQASSSSSSCGRRMCLTRGQPQKPNNESLLCWLQPSTYPLSEPTPLFCHNCQRLMPLCPPSQAPSRLPPPPLFRLLGDTLVFSTLPPHHSSHPLPHCTVHFFLPVCKEPRFSDSRPPLEAQPHQEECQPDLPQCHILGWKVDPCGLWLWRPFLVEDFL